MNWNKYNLEVGETVILDEKYANNSEVKILSFTPNFLFATVTPIKANDDTVNWQTMTNRLTRKIK